MKILNREPWRGGQICGHQMSYGTGHASEFCGEFKALGLRLCQTHNEETGEEIGRWAPGNAEGLELVADDYGWSLFDAAGDLVASSNDRADLEATYGFTLTYEPNEDINA